MKILMLRGLPASGKSTWAKEWVAKYPAGAWKRINKDDLRSMLDAGRWSKGNESFIIKLRDDLIRQILTNGAKGVIVDDTNLAPKHEARLRELAKELGAEFQIMDFTATVHECIERDAKRANGVGKDVIWGMWKDFMIPKVEWPKNRSELEPAIICDLDGTICDIEHRSPYDTAKCEDDGLDQITTDCVAHLATANSARILFVSGRSDKFREQTENWLRRYGWNPANLFMRKDGDNRKDWMVKLDILRNHIAPKYNPIAVFDDRDQVVAMWRAQGLKVFQVADGNF